MGDRYDRLRSIVKSAADSAAGAIAEATQAAKLKKTFEELRDRRTRVPARLVARAVLRAGTTSAASVRLVPGRIEISAELASGRSVAAALVPDQVSFAPRGAKEIWFAVDPPDAAAEPAIREMAAMIASSIARAAWNPLLPPMQGEVDGPALVDREEHRLRIDLRTAPAIRSVQSTGKATGLLLDLIEIDRIDVDPSGIAVRIALPKRLG